MCVGSQCHSEQSSDDPPLNKNDHHHSLSPTLLYLAHSHSISLLLFYTHTHTHCLSSSLLLFYIHTYAHTHSLSHTHTHIPVPEPITCTKFSCKIFVMHDQLFGSFLFFCWSASIPISFSTSLTSFICINFSLVTILPSFYCQVFFSQRTTNLKIFCRVEAIHFYKESDNGPFSLNCRNGRDK